MKDSFYSLYFGLQWKRFKRFSEAQGLDLFLWLPISLLIIAAYSFMVPLLAGDYSDLVYLGTAILLLFQLSNRSSNGFFLDIFHESDFYKIRLIENSVIVGLFGFAFLYLGCYWHLLALLVFGCGTAFFVNEAKALFRIPTPFNRYPFEYVIGFRKYWALYFLAHLLCGIALFVGNFNLGLFTLIGCFWIGMSFYSYHEPIDFVWIHTNNARGFIWRKLFNGSINALISVLPINIGLLLFFSDLWYWLILANGIGTLYICVAILMKYAFYPSWANILQGVLLVIAILFPPVLLLLIPYYYIKSINNVKPILG